MDPRPIPPEQPASPFSQAVSSQRATPREKRASAGFLATFIIVAVLAVGGMAASFGAGVLFERAAADEPAQVTQDTEIQTFQNAWDVVVDNYVDTSVIDEQQMLDAAIRGMLTTLDDEGHTRYLTAEETVHDQQSSQGAYVGIGVLVEPTEDAFRVVTPYDGSPAREAGIQPGDLIVGINGEDVRGQDVSQVITKIRGPEGSEVSVTIEREGEPAPLTFTMVRREITISSVSWVMLDGEVALLRLSQFTAGASEDLAEALQQAKDAGARGVILDLRNNPGGYINEAINIASMFIPEDATVFISETRDGGREEHKATEQPVQIGDLPLIVLINEGSASSSEIVSGAIKAAGSGILIGETTTGTGTVLHQFQLGDGSTIWLGVELWLTPDGELIKKQGIPPDVVVALAEDQQPFDPTLEAPGSPAPEELNDSQLQYALDDLLDQLAGE
jgi:carboxyl-terminal processing protease